MKFSLSLLVINITLLMRGSFANTICETYDTDPNLKFTYLNPRTLTKKLKIVNNKHPSITHLYSLGKSVEGKNFYFL